MLTLLMGAAALHTARAQDIGGGGSDEAATALWRVGPFVGAAHNSPVTYLGVTRHRDHLFVGLEASTQVLRVGAVRLSYTVQLLPLVLIGGRQAPDGYYRPDVPGPERAYAWGLSPFGFELSTPSTRRVAVYGAAAAGGLVFSRPFPVPEADRVNFTLEYGGGLLVRVAARQWLRAGYKYHHLSNAYTSRYNPGLDGNVLYGGYEWAVRLPR